MTDAPPLLVPPLLFDRALRRTRLARAAQAGGAGDFLAVRAAEDAAFSLSAILRDFPLAVDLSVKGGALARALAGAPAAAARVGTLIQASTATPGASGAGLRVVLDDERPPFAAQSLDLIVSLLSLHWTNDLVGALIQIRLALRPDGLFLGAFLGGSTLNELRQSLTEAEAEITGGAGPRVSPFADALDAAGLLQRAGFALPVSGVDRVCARYDHPLKLVADLRAMGETNALVDRPRRPLTRTVLARMFEIYAERFADADGRLRATFEIVSLAGWAPHASQQKPLRPGSAKMRLADALGVVERRAEPG